MKDREGKEVSASEFIQRWKEGIKKITPLQQTNVQLNGTYLVLIGVIIGLYSTFHTKMWWMFIILLGSLVLVGVSWIGMKQKQHALKEMESLIKQASEEQTKQNEETKVPLGVG